MAALPPLEKSLILPDAPIWRLTVAQYHHMIDSGILTDDDPVELLEGWLVTKMPKNPPHSLGAQLTADTLSKILPTGWFINIHEPITTVDSEPEPDVAIVRGVRRDYAERHPYPADLALVIEVADATLQRDQTLKLRLYAEAGIPVYWILNLQERQLEVYSQPAQGEYRQQATYAPADTVPLVIEEKTIAQVTVGDLLP